MAATRMTMMALLLLTRFNGADADAHHAAAGHLPGGEVDPAVAAGRHFGSLAALDLAPVFVRQAHAYPANRLGIIRGADGDAVADRANIVRKVHFVDIQGHSLDAAPVLQRLADA